MKLIKYIGFSGLAILLGVVITAAVVKDTKKELSNNQFMVITVKGKILFQKSGNPMKRGDLYQKGIPLDFIEKSSRAAVANEKSGRWVITPNKRGETSILPAANNLSSRSGGLLNMLDLKNFFDDRVLALDDLKLEVSSANFPMDDKKFFYVKYKHEKETIAKKLSFRGDTLIFSKEEIFKIDGQPITVEEKEMTLYYKGDEKTYKINKFTPVFPDMKELKEEIQTLMEYSASKSNEDKFDEVGAFLSDFYGKTATGNLKGWLVKEFELG